jgi:hypothetical protein
MRIPNIFQVKETLEAQRDQLQLHLDMAAHREALLEARLAELQDRVSLALKGKKSS